MNRREFVKKSLLVCASTTLGSGALSAYSEGNQSPAPKMLESKTRILFQGDSITDASRSRQRETMANDQQMLGWGYAQFAAARLLCDHAAADLSIYNRAISGNKVYQLQERWQKDCLELEPDILSILIGTNDFWHTLRDDNPYKGTSLTYRDDYRKLLDSTKSALPNVKLVIGEPFAIKGGSAIDARWESYASYQEVARDIAKEYDAIFIPYQSLFDEAMSKGDHNTWGADGVHPSMAGMQLMADCWLENVLNKI